MANILIRDFQNFQTSVPLILEEASLKSKIKGWKKVIF